MNYHMLYLMLLLIITLIFLYKYKKVTSEYIADLDSHAKQLNSIGEDLEDLRVAHRTLLDQRMAQLERILDLHDKADTVDKRVKDNGYATTADVENLMRIIEAIKGIKLELL